MCDETNFTQAEKIISNWPKWKKDLAQPDPKRSRKYKPENTRNSSAMLEDVCLDCLDFVKNSKCEICPIPKLKKRLKN